MLTQHLQYRYQKVIAVQTRTYEQSGLSPKLQPIGMDRNNTYISRQVANTDIIQAASLLLVHC